MSSMTVPQPMLPENRSTPFPGNRSRHVFRTGPYDAFDPGPWPWRRSDGYCPDLRTGRHRRNEFPDPLPAPPAAAAPPRPPRSRPRPYPVDPFSKLREDAWAAFLADSEPLAAAHNAPRAASRIGRIKAAFLRAVHRVTLSSRTCTTTS
ncbi:hypothetical protein [Glycomyces buryatensis]|uniref:Uncharacterized protein n=1 Tax=Glycomyces buryatensis TaxID=2570927 RepID=A0A4S8QIW0_9ACTN|nr:hypothetical protein [Glycomyces buryatensis]THV41309.1 hypothetical protein FAB82_12145 [Glycomyces buryatensis]